MPLLPIHFIDKISHNFVTESLLQTFSHVFSSTVLSERYKTPVVMTLHF